MSKRDSFRRTFRLSDHRPDVERDVDDELSLYVAVPRAARARWVREVTDGVLDVEDGALYTSLHRMEKRRWLRSEWGISEKGRRAKYYALSAAGRRRLEAEMKSWTRYAEAVFKVIQAPAEP